MTLDEVKALFAEQTGICIDVGCGSVKLKGWCGMDSRPLKGVDIVHDIQSLPWPIPDSSVKQIRMNHVWEHIEPKNRLCVMDEAWRIIESKGQILISAPHATSLGANQDPTHYPCPNEVTFTYFDPKYPMYNVYQPKPWTLLASRWEAGNAIEVRMEAKK